MDISGFGLSVNLIASNTFPNGITITQFSDDSDPFDVPAIKIGDAKTGLNGDLITWSTATPILIDISVIPNSPDDINLAILMEANRVGANKQSAQDVISMTGAYPDGSTVTVNSGKMLEGMPASAVSSSGKLKTKVYKFAFQNKTGVSA
jgi:hypothetical protein